MGRAETRPESIELHLGGTGGVVPKRAKTNPSASHCIPGASLVGKPLRKAVLSCGVASRVESENLSEKKT